MSCTSQFHRSIHLKGDYQAKLSIMSYNSQSNLHKTQALRMCSKLSEAETDRPRLQSSAA